MKGKRYRGGVPKGGRQVAHRMPNNDLRKLLDMPLTARQQRRLLKKEKPHGQP